LFGFLNKQVNGMDPLLRARLALGVRDRKLAELHANELRILGFAITQISQRGVGFEGAKDLFEEVFKCRIEVLHGNVKIEHELRIPERLSRQVDSIYFPTKPTFFE
jgi:hypothetical protein